ncbi:MAG TPA: nucleoside/nucleotide kinase family protein [Jiangellales bacterium]|nr:nucleoside/nucleotide kinase family protein [Jiangellales bacterium]
MPDEVDLDAAVRRATGLARPDGRAVLGIAGPPGAGKSTVAAAVVGALGPERAVLVPMDGFHLAGSALRRLGREARKGAPDTFDRDGYVALLGRLRVPDGRVVWAPEFRREIEEPVACAIAVEPSVPLVVTEGNYLLLWPEVRPLLDECWWVEADRPVRLARLTARHAAYGKDPQAARDWAEGPDEANARLVAAGRARADVVVRPG